MFFLGVFGLEGNAPITHGHAWPVRASSGFACSSFLTPWRTWQYSAVWSLLNRPAEAKHSVGKHMGFPRGRLLVGRQTSTDRLAVGLRVFVLGTLVGRLVSPPTRVRSATAPQVKDQRPWFSPARVLAP